MLNEEQQTTSKITSLLLSSAEARKFQQSDNSNIQESLTIYRKQVNTPVANVTCMHCIRILNNLLLSQQQMLIKL